MTAVVIGAALGNPSDADSALAAEAACTVHNLFWEPEFPGFEKCIHTHAELCRWIAYNIRTTRLTPTRNEVAQFLTGH